MFSIIYGTNFSQHLQFRNVYAERYLLLYTYIIEILEEAYMTYNSKVLWLRRLLYLLTKECILCMGNGHKVFHIFLEYGVEIHLACT